MEIEAIRKTFIYRSVRDHASQCPLGAALITLPKHLVDEFAFKVATHMLSDSISYPPCDHGSNHPERTGTADPSSSAAAGPDQ